VPGISLKLLLTYAVSLSTTEWNVGVGMPLLTILGQESLRAEFFGGIPVLGIAMNVKDMYVYLTTFRKDKTIV